ncbi:hypothetical protein G7046_g4740 [Stylonectria norvegica]|nr:hypothetical protein G7046_g4740 [Stylonectria norvegica]
MAHSISSANHTPPDERFPSGNQPGEWTSRPNGLVGSRALVQPCKVSHLEQTKEQPVNSGLRRSQLVLGFMVSAYDFVRLDANELHDGGSPVWEIRNMCLPERGSIVLVLLGCLSSSSVVSWLGLFKLPLDVKGPVGGPGSRFHAKGPIAVDKVPRAEDSNDDLARSDQHEF